MQIKRTDSGLLHSNMYLVEENGHAIVIDPCMDLSDAAQYTVDYVLLTHEHYDHISGVNEWKKETGAPLLCSSACAACIRNPRKNLSRYFDAFCRMQTWIPVEDLEIRQESYSCEADQTFEDSLEFHWQGHTVTLLETPGHSPGSIVIGIDHTDYFTGDSLLEKDETGLRFPGSSVKSWESIGKQRIHSIPDGARIWPGHFEGFTKKERQQI